MDNVTNLGVVRPSYGAMRRALLPIYASDQLIFFALAALPFILLATLNPRLALYMGIGGYIGAMLTMQRSTPSSLLLPHGAEPRVVELLDASRYMERTDQGGEWVSTRGRLRRWSTDTIRLNRAPDGLLVTGRLLDLQIIAHKLAS